MATITQPRPHALVRRRTRRSVVGRAGAMVADRTPGAMAWARDAGARVRTAALTLGGLGLVTAAAWEVDSALGKVVAGVSLGLIEFLTGGDDETGDQS